MIRRALVAALAACSLCCSLPPMFGGVNTASRETRFELLPINAFVPIAPEFTGAKGRMLGRVTRYLGVQGYERNVVGQSTTEKLWRDSIAQVEASDSASHDFRGAIRVLAKKLEESASFDALVVASLVYRKARLYRNLVKWDGVIRRLPRVKDEARRISDSYKATIVALSLHVMVFDAGGELIFENYGGLDLVHEFEMNRSEGTLEAKLLETLLDKERFLNEGVELAFEPYIERPRSSKW